MIGHVPLSSIVEDGNWKLVSQETVIRYQSEYHWSFRPGLGDIDVYPEVNNGRHLYFVILQDTILHSRLDCSDMLEKTSMRS